MMDAIRELALRWYILTSSLTAGAMPAFQTLDARIGVPFISALLLGVLGAAAPCQLTQSISMLTILGRQSAGRPRWQAAAAYLSGKALVYSALGVLAVLLGAGMSGASIPVFVAARKALGPLMIVVGLTMAGALRWSWIPGASLTARLRTVADQRAAGAPFLLGVAFGLSFCPTLLALFAGLLLPLALSRPDGVVYPALFALGTALPLLAILGLVSLGGESLRHYARPLGRGQQVIGVLAGLLLIVIGINDTVIYWLI
jgi:cytochrome c-type biogenesis protein